MNIYTTKHSKKRLKKRYGLNSFKSLLPKEALLYQDAEDSAKWYYNLEDGYLVLKDNFNGSYTIVTVIRGNFKDFGNVKLQKNMVLK